MEQHLDLKDAYCLAPWVNIHINSATVIKPCCSWNENYQSIQNYLSGNEHGLSKLKTQLATNNPSNYCKKCVERNWYSEFKDHKIQLNDIEDFSIKSIDVRWASTCQLSCMYCNENWSSTWARLVSNKKNIPIQSNRIKDTETILELFSKHNISRVSLLGGEPLLLRENLKLLDVIPFDAGIEIFTSLNVDLDSNEIYKKLITRPNVNWYVSMENVNDKFEFVRRGAVWKTQVSNLIHLKNTNPKSVSLQSQYCAYSAFDLVDLYQFSSDHNLFVNLTCENFSIQVLDVFSYPKDFKILALEEINKCITKFPESNFKLTPIKEKLIKDMDVVVPDIIQKCVRWHQTRETKFFNNQYNFVDLWPQFGKTSI